VKYSSLGAAVAAFSVFSSAPALAKANAGAAPEVAIITPQTCAFRGTTVDCTGRLKGKVLTRESFAKIPGNTTELFLRNNALRTIPAGALARLGELRTLDLAFNDFGTLDADVFSNLTKLEDLDLYHSNINYLPTGIFDSTQGFVLGSGFDAATQMGPLISAKQRERVQAYLELGQKQGGRLVAGGDAADGPGFFFKPAVFADVRPDMAIYREEIFGPVLAATPFDDIDTAIRLGNDSIYGLGASVWTNNLGLANRIMRRLKAGTVWVNCHNLLDPAVPFGGFGMSGYGKELGSAARDLYTEAKSVTVALG